MQKNDKISLRYLFWNFLKIGAISWGGFMALISVVRKQMVEKDKTIKDEVIFDGISLASVLPGPVAFNVVTYIGYSLRGIAGAAVSMIAIILPSFFLILLLAMVYVHYGELTSFHYFFLGVLPAISAVVISVAINMFRKQVEDWKQLILCIVSGFTLLFLHTFWVTFAIIITGGLFGLLLYRGQISGIQLEDKTERQFPWRKIAQWSILILAFVFLVWWLPSIFSGRAKESMQFFQTIFLTFSGMSLTLFGGGYVIIPAMQEIIVNTFHWLSIKEFSDAIAMGQITPGPIFISATFIGFRVAGWIGAIIATIAIFFPPGILMIVLSGFLNNIKNSVIVAAAFKGMRPAIIGMIFSAAITIGKSADMAWGSAFIFVSALTLLIYFRVNVVYLIPLSGVVGMLLFQL